MKGKDSFKQHVKPAGKGSFTKGGTGGPLPSMKTPVATQKAGVTGKAKGGAAGGKFIAGGTGGMKASARTPVATQKPGVTGKSGGKSSKKGM